jgi:hypothetical protein
MVLAMPDCLCYFSKSAHLLLLDLTLWGQLDH